MNGRNWNLHDLERLIDDDLPALDAKAIEHDLDRSEPLRARLAAVRALDDAICDALLAPPAFAQKLKQPLRFAPTPSRRSERRPTRGTAASFNAILLAAASVLIVVGAGMYFSPRREPHMQPHELHSEIPRQPSWSASTRRFGAAPLNALSASRVGITSESPTRFDQRRLPPPASLRVQPPSLLAQRGAEAPAPAHAGVHAQAPASPAPTVHSTADARALFEGLAAPQRLAAAELLMRDPALRSVAFQELVRLRGDDDPSHRIEDLVRRLEQDPELRTWTVAYQLSRPHVQPQRMLPNGT